jgi:2-C-methyl-D-erythritol 4-phosphate cytidylyltransferase/2-C-methyl-D-erythritol 2,4-cyclodiphosphate synthase
VSELGVLIVAAGRGQRFGGPVPKQYASLGGKAVLRRTVEAFARLGVASSITVVIAPSDRALYEAAVGDLGLAEPVAGGVTRQQSVLNGLESMAARPPAFVAIHDAARPFADAPLIERTLAAARAVSVSGAIPALPVVDTLKQGANGRVVGPQSRDGLWRAQTPQIFRFDAILRAHRAAAGLGASDATALTDDAAVAEHAGLAVALAVGDERNTKITSSEDLDRAGRELTLAGGGEMRSGMGFDVHAFGPGDHVMLCGVSVPHTQALMGHSDADVALHALTDALLGAIAAGDIGQHFPPGDPQWRGAPSERFLRHAADMVAQRRGRVVNVDVTIVCERPKVGPLRDAMAANVARILGVSASRVGVKATTTERLGFTGRGEGIAAQAIAVVELPRDLP